MKLFIPGNVASSKNSKVMGRFHSKTVKKYLKSFGINTFSSGKKEVTPYKTTPMTFPVEELKELFSNYEYPFEIGFHFVRGSRHKFDFHNAVQILFDLFTAFDIIEDDNADCVAPRCIWKHNQLYSYDKESPGVEITVIKPNIDISNEEVYNEGNKLI